ncbi:S24 family peptidase [Aliivibrio fischeri]|uniref:S24 family peptidase n=1 Tax=Aliivibrio fischeri TaxID=668 RepID=UPI00084C81AF|nr:S24 family peptidase [Aliivibrio fischeri]OED53646.1 phage repressor protein [Aliivibrio fischeri]
MNDISIRIKKKRKLLGLTQAELAGSLNVKPQAVSGWERGLSQPRGKQLSALSAIFSVDKTWLLYGENQKSDNQCCGKVITLVPFFENINAAAGDGFFNSEISNQNVYPIPTDIINSQSNKESIFCIKALGNSMEPMFNDGAILAVNPNKKNIVDGRIYVLRMNNRLRVKSIRENQVGLVLNSYHPDYQSETIEWASFSNLSFEIVGEVFWYSSKINN